MDAQQERGNRLLNGWQLSALMLLRWPRGARILALAAEELSLTPSAVSHRMNQLEEELGIQLLKPTARINPRRQAGVLGAEVIPR